MKKQKRFRRIIFSVLLIGVIFLGGIYIYGFYRGHTDARDAVDNNRLPYWHVIGKDTSIDLPPAPSRYMDRFVHETKWSIYWNGYIKGYNRVALGWAENAKQWVHKAAEKGDAEAQRKLGFMYSQGDGVTQDIEASLTWYLKAAEQGDACAQFYLGFVYDTGDGVTEDNNEAVKWYRKAAQQGHTLAQNNLGRMYHNGDGVEQDEVEALAWTMLAEKGGIRKLRDLLKALDSYPEIKSQAEQRAKEIAAENRVIRFNQRVSE